MRSTRERPRSTTAASMGPLPGGSGNSVVLGSYWVPLKGLQWGRFPEEAEIMRHSVRFWPV